MKNQNAATSNWSHKMKTEFKGACRGAALVLALVLLVGAMGGGTAGGQTDDGGGAVVGAAVEVSGVQILFDKQAFLPLAPLVQVSLGFVGGRADHAGAGGRASPADPGPVVYALPAALPLLGVPLPVPDYPVAAVVSESDAQDAEFEGRFGGYARAHARSGAFVAETGVPHVAIGDAGQMQVNIRGIHSQGRVDRAGNCEATNAIAAIVIADVFRLDGIVTRARTGDASPESRGSAVEVNRVKVGDAVFEINDAARPGTTQLSEQSAAVVGRINDAIQTVPLLAGSGLQLRILEQANPTTRSSTSNSVSRGLELTWHTEAAAPVNEYHTIRVRLGHASCSQQQQSGP